MDRSLAALVPPGPWLGSQSQADLLGWLSSIPPQLVRGTAELDAYLLDAGGQPVTDAKGTFDTDMTNMSHGLSLTPALSAGNGHYLGRVHFSMPNPWRGGVLLCCRMQARLR